MYQHSAQPTGNQSGPFSDRPRMAKSGPRLKVSRPVSAADPPFGILPHAFNADPRLKSNDVRVLVALLSFAWGDAPECWPSLKAIGERSGLKEKSVRIAMQALEHFGYVRTIRDDSKVSHRRILLLFRLGDDPLKATPQGDISPRQREVRRVQKYRKTSVIEPSVITDPPLRNYGPPPLRNYGPEEEASFKKQEEKKRSAESPAPQPQPPALSPPDGGAENDLAAPISNENETDGGKADPSPGPDRASDRNPELTPEQRSIAERMLRSGIPTLVEEARKKLASDGVKRLPSPPAPGEPKPVGVFCTPTLGTFLGKIGAPPKSANSMRPGEVKVATARAIEGAKRRGNPEVYEAIERLGPDCGRGVVDRVVRLLCREFKRTDQQDMQGAYTQVARQVESGERPASCLADAFECSSGEKVKNPGAAFGAAIRRYDRNGGAIPRKTQ